jgi:hypothetical protein
MILPALLIGAWLAGLGSGTATDPVLPAGYEAVSQNPAALVLPGQPVATLEYLRARLCLTSSSLTLGDCRDYLFRPSFLDEADKQRLLDHVGPGPLRLGIDADLQLLHGQYRSFGVAADYQLLANVFLPRDLCELALRGNELNRVYELDGLGSDTMTFLRLTVAHGMLVCPHTDVPWLDTIRVGVGLSWLHGLRYSAVTASTGELLTTPYTMTGFVHQVQSQADGGDGFGLTVGGSLPLGDRLHLDLVLRDPIGIIFWYDNPRAREVSYKLKSLDVPAFIREPRLDSFLVRTTVSRPGAAISTRLPGVLAFGGGYQPSKILSVGATVNLPVTSSPPNSIPASAQPFVGLQVKLVPIQSAGIGISAGWGGQQGPAGRSEGALWIQLLLGIRVHGLLFSTGAEMTGRKYESVKTAAFQLGLGYEFR